MRFVTDDTDLLLKKVAQSFKVIAKQSTTLFQV